ncbi:SDR family oxidoreductase [Sneathiella sp.]|jgi:UDP-glucose 4-epimerase|uniref:SDR family oxidoreductase n=1 Tax=Sneathiella sp. TaxID=1964365 RepID=UPI0039E268EA
MKVLITGGAGLVGRAVLKEWKQSDEIQIIATDIVPISTLPDHIQFRKMDVTSPEVECVIAEERPDVILHLASIVSPPKGMTDRLAYDVDVGGTRRVLEAAIKYKVQRLVVTSSGAAYGYHADNSVPLKEEDPIRGNSEFAYAHHKRLVEEMLAEARSQSPDLQQVILRVGTILGAETDNQITALFKKDRLLGLSGYESPFVFIWTKDLARILIRASTDGACGIFNVAGDGALGVSDLGRILGKKIRRVPAWLVKLGLGIARPIGLSRYGPEQVRFLQFRPVLDNTKLKEEFGYTPELTSEQVFVLWKEQAGL